MTTISANFFPSFSSLLLHYKQAKKCVALHIRPCATPQKLIGNILAKKWKEVIFSKKTTTILTAAWMATLPVVIYLFKKVNRANAEITELHKANAEITELHKEKEKTEEKNNFLKRRLAQLSSQREDFYYRENELTTKLLESDKLIVRLYEDYEDLVESTDKEAMELEKTLSDQQFYLNEILEENKGLKNELLDLETIDDDIDGVTRRLLQKNKIKIAELNQQIVILEASAVNSKDLEKQLNELIISTNKIFTQKNNEINKLKRELSNLKVEIEEDKKENITPKKGSTSEEKNQNNPRPLATVNKK